MIIAFINNTPRLLRIEGGIIDNFPSLVDGMDRVRHVQLFITATMIYSNKWKGGIRILVHN